MSCTPLQRVYSALHCAGITPNNIPHITGLGATTSGSTLPFTGFDLTLIVLAGLFLIVLGFSIRRIGRNA